MSERPDLQPNTNFKKVESSPERRTDLPLSPRGRSLNYFEFLAKLHLASVVALTTYTLGNLRDSITQPVKGPSLEDPREPHVQKGLGEN
jgi:hypothetical protein